MSNENFKNNNERMKYLNSKHNEISDRQEENLLIDFDEALKEQSEKEIKIKFLNKFYSLPESMPFNFSTFFLRHCYKKINNKMVVVMPEEKTMDFLKLMFGNDFLQSLEKSTNRNVTINFVYKTIVPKIMEQWGYSMDASKKTTDKIEKKMQIQGS